MKIEKINKRFEKIGNSIVKHRWVLLSTFVLITFIGINGLKYMNISSSWEDYFLEDDPVLIKTEEFKEIFGNDNFVAVLTRCDDTFTQKNLQLIRELSNELMDSISYADKITSLTDIEFLRGTEYGMEIEQIVPEVIPTDPIGLDSIRQKAYFKKNIANRLVSKDGKLSWIILKLRAFPTEEEWKTDKNSTDPALLTGMETDRIIKKAKYADIAPLATGMPYVTYRKMDWVGKEMPRVLGLAMLVALVVLLLFTKSARGVIIPVVTTVCSILISYGILGYAGYTIDSSMITIPALLAFAVGVAYNLHIFSYFKRQFYLHGNRIQAVKETIAEMGWPVMFSALTTLTALLSFLLIPVIPLHFIGIATSSIVLLSFFIAITIMPIMLSFGKNREPHPIIEKKGGSWLDRTLSKMGEKVLNNEKIILSLFTVLTVFLLIGASKIIAAFDIETTMGRKIEYVNDLLNVSESELGSAYSYDVLIEFPENNMAKEPENLIKLDSLSQHIMTYPLTKRTTSILNIIKDLNQTLNENNETYYQVPANNEQVAQMLLLYENAGGSEAEYWTDYEYKRLRIMVEIADYNSKEAEDELAEVMAFSAKLFPNAKVTTVGNLPQFTAMMQYVVRGQIVSLGISLIIISILLMIVFGNIRIGLIGIIPNIVPAITVAGIMGWCGMPLDMMTATIMPMILGLAVDDTIHFFNHGHLEFDRKRNYNQAIKRTFFIVGTPLVLTSLIISANFAVYGISEAVSFVNMGILAVSGMLSALLADLCVTPLLFRRFKIFGQEKE